MPVILDKAVCIHKIRKLTGKPRKIENEFQAARILQKLALTPEELVILKCLAVFTIGTFIIFFFLINTFANFFLDTM